MPTPTATKPKAKAVKGAPSNGKVTPRTPKAKATAERKPRGRPRPDDVIDRDELIYKRIGTGKKGVTLDALVEATGLPRKAVYLSVFRLKRDGWVVRADGGATRVARWARA